MRDLLPSIGIFAVKPGIATHCRLAGTELTRAIGRDLKGKLSPVVYFIAIISAFINEWISGVLYIAVALVWLIPDRRIEEKINGE